MNKIIINEAYGSMPKWLGEIIKSGTYNGNGVDIDGVRSFRNFLKDYGIRLDKLKVHSHPNHIPDSVKDPMLKSPYISIWLIIHNGILFLIVQDKPSDIASVMCDYIIYDFKKPGDKFHTKWVSFKALKEAAVEYAYIDSSDMDNYELTNRIAQRRDKWDADTAWRTSQRSKELDTLYAGKPDMKPTNPGADARDKSGYPKVDYAALHSDEVKDMIEGNYEHLCDRVNNMVESAENSADYIKNHWVDVLELGLDYSKFMLPIKSKIDSLKSIKKTISNLLKFDDIPTLKGYVADEMISMYNVAKQNITVVRDTLDEFKELTNKNKTDSTQAINLDEQQLTEDSTNKLNAQEKSELKRVVDATGDPEMVVAYLQNKENEN